MKQIKIINAYSTINDISQNGLTLKGKWVLYQVRISLASQYDFYLEESQKLFDSYKTISDGTTIKFETVELANEYKAKQAEIDNFDVDMMLEKQECKLSDIPNITVTQMEALQDFIEFIPE